MHEQALLHCVESPNLANPTRHFSPNVVGYGALVKWGRLCEGIGFVCQTVARLGPLMRPCNPSALLSVNQKCPGSPWVSSLRFDKSQKSVPETPSWQNAAQRFTVRSCYMRQEMMGNRCRHTLRYTDTTLTTETVLKTTRRKKAWRNSGLIKSTKLKYKMNIHKVFSIIIDHTCPHKNMELKPTSPPPCVSMCVPK